MDENKTKLTEADIRKMKRGQLEALIKANNLDIEVKVGETNAQLIDAIIQQLGGNLSNAIVPINESKQIKAQSKQGAKEVLYKQAQKVAQDNNVKTVYANSKGEFFTSKNYALISEAGKESQIKTFSFESEVSEADEQTDEDDE